MELDGLASPSLDQLKALALTNYGHFTSMLVEDGRVRGLSLHIQRLTHDCEALFNTTLDIERVRACIRRALHGSTPRTVVRVTIYDPQLDLGTIGNDAHPRILVTTRPASADVPPPLRLQAASYQREMPTTKHIGLLGAMQMRRAAQRDGFDDVLFLSPDGTISEIATSNIGFVRSGQIVWPRSPMLPGVTMALLRQALDEPTAPEPLTLGDLSHVEAAFATNAATGIRPVISVDDIEWASESHPALADLRAQYSEIPAETV